MRRGLLAITAITVMAAVVAPFPVAGSATAASCSTGRAEGVQSVEQVPWAQQWLALDRAWPLGHNGSGVRVAVVDTGVDNRHPQLAQAVLPGADFVAKGDGRLDCTGHGTGIASLIAARRDAAVGFAGVAPEAQILPVRVAERLGDDIVPARVASGVDWAVAHGAKIITLGFMLPGESPAVRAAIARAVAAGVFVVTSAGVADRSNSGPPPTAYPGVVAVSAIGVDGEADGGTLAGPQVSLAAPGLKVVAAAPARGHTMYSGGDMAAAVVSGVAALVLAAWPDMSGPAVAARLAATADPSPQGAASMLYGAGIVSPVRALSEPSVGAAVPGGPVSMPFPASAQKTPSVTGAQVITGIALVGAVVMLIGIALRRARARQFQGRTP